MSGYHKPLTIYCRATSLGRVIQAECDDVVNGFFASRLSDPGFLNAWATSGMRLRQWLRNGLNFYVREQLRTRIAIDRIESGAIDTAAGDSRDANAPSESGAAADAVFERAWAASALESAMASTRRALRDAGRECDWELFWNQKVRSVPCEMVARERGMTEAQVRQRVFAVAEQMRYALREVLVKDGAPTPDLAQEIRSMMEALHGHGT
ncbi:MAG: hypothetical protein EXS03_04930 [Phycisphaerales bacterium]|nr:hypothetical protein [Phycisphaerales bacterium]